MQICSMNKAKRLQPGKTPICSTLMLLDSWYAILKRLRIFVDNMVFLSFEGKNINHHEPFSVQRRQTNMKCQVCSQETLLPFRCPHCGGQFCSDPPFTRKSFMPKNRFCPHPKARASNDDSILQLLQLQLCFWSRRFQT